VFEIEMLPAREGDCLWLRYGSAKMPRQILVDAGRSATYQKDLRPRLLALPPRQRTFELFVITHIDRDHIEGALDLLEDDSLPVRFKQIWFNGYDHLHSAEIETFGALQGERLTTALLKWKPAWNRCAKGRAIRVRGTTLPKIKLDSGMTLTVLSPDR
jgi:beta-lactamase superfamily II metal-dependent hydrolase